MCDNDKSLSQMLPPCMNYLPTLSENWQHSRGNVGKMYVNIAYIEHIWVLVTIVAEPCWTTHRTHLLIADISGGWVAVTGYANDHADSSLLDKHAPNLAKLPTTNGPFATGVPWFRDGIMKCELCGPSMSKLIGGVSYWFEEKRLSTVLFLKSPSLNWILTAAGCAIFLCLLFLFLAFYTFMAMMTSCTAPQTSCKCNTS